MLKKLSLLLSFILIVSISKAQNPTLSVGLEALTMSKGAIDVQALTEIIMEKQAELKNEALKRFMLKLFPETNYSTKFYIQNCLNILLNEKNPQVIKKEIFELTTNYALALGIAKAFSMRSEYGAINDVYRSYRSKKEFEPAKMLEDYKKSRFKDHHVDASLQKVESIKSSQQRLIIEIRKLENDLRLLKEDSIKDKRKIHVADSTIFARYRTLARLEKDRLNAYKGLTREQMRQGLTNVQTTDISKLPFGIWVDVVSAALSSMDSLKAKGFFKKSIDYKKDRFFLSLSDSGDGVLRDSLKALEKDIVKTVGPFIIYHDIIKEYYSSIVSDTTKSINAKIKATYLKATTALIGEMNLDNLVNKDVLKKFPFIEQHLKKIKVADTLIRNLDLNQQQLSNIDQYEAIYYSYFDLVSVDSLAARLKDRFVNAKETTLKKDLMTRLFTNRPNVKSLIADIANEYAKVKTADATLNLLNVEASDADFNQNLNEIDALWFKNKAELIKLNQSDKTDQRDTSFKGIIKLDPLLSTLNIADKKDKFIDALNKIDIQKSKIRGNLQALRRKYQNFKNSEANFSKLQSNFVDLAVKNISTSKLTLESQDAEFNTVIDSLKAIDPIAAGALIKTRDEYKVLKSNAFQFINNYAQMLRFFSDNKQPLQNYNIKTENLANQIGKVVTDLRIFERTQVDTILNRLAGSTDFFRGVMTKISSDLLMSKLIGKPDTLTESNKEFHAEYTKLISEIYKRLNSYIKQDKLSLSDIKYIEDVAVPELIRLGSLLSKEPETLKNTTIQFNLLANIMKVQALSKIPELERYSETLLEVLKFISGLGELDKANTYQDMLALFEHSNTLLQDNLEDGEFKSTYTLFTNAVIKYTLVNTEKEYVEIDVVSFLDNLQQYFGRNNHSIFGLYLTLGLNQNFFFRKVDIGDAEGIKNIGFASEKLGLKLRFNRFRYLKGLEHAVKSDVNLNTNAPFIDEWYGIVYGSGLLYSLANTATNKNFDYPHVGVGTGIRFYNALDLNLVLGIPFIKNQSPFRNTFIGLGLDIPLGAYLEKIGNKK